MAISINPTTLDFLNILAGNITLIDKITVYDTDIEVIVRPQHVKKMLEEYLANKISAVHLTRWADFLCYREEYVSINFEDEEADAISDYYENMWHVLQMISTPFLDGAITPMRVQGYLTELTYFYNDS